MSEMAMFPLGSVLFPHLPLHLRVFEERYLVMLSELLESETAEFGVVLIERGQEVGGGEQRFSYGTVAQIVELGTDEGFVALVAQGERRFRVLQWLEESPYPRARVETLPALTDDAAVGPLRERAERLVRRTLAQASEFGEQQWPPDVQLSPDPVAAAWQLAGIAPVGPLDQVALLRASSLAGLLDGVVEATEGVRNSFGAPWPDRLDDGPGDAGPA